MTCLQDSHTDSFWLTMHILDMDMVSLLRKTTRGQTCRRDWVYFGPCSVEFSFCREGGKSVDD